MFGKDFTAMCFGFMAIMDMILTYGFIFCFNCRAFSLMVDYNEYYFIVFCGHYFCDGFIWPFQKVLGKAVRGVISQNIQSVTQYSIFVVVIK